MRTINTRNGSRRFPALLALCVLPAIAMAQRHNGLSSPPTAPPAHSNATTPTIVPVSTGLGPLQVAAVNYGVPAPQSLTRQLQADDDRIRIAALSALGTPGQYLTRGRVPYPHSIQLDFIALGTTDELDAILTIELDQHIVSAILVPEGDSWHRIATVIDPTSFSDVSVTPATFLRTARSLMQHERYRAIYRASSTNPAGDFSENEAHLRIVNGKVSVLISFVSTARTCSTTPKHNGCDLIRRWLQPDPADPSQRFLLITGTGHLSSHEAGDPIAPAPIYQQAHIHSFACQPYIYSDSTQRYEPTANSGACPANTTPDPHKP